MDQASITQYITDTFNGVDVVVASGDSFFFYDPGRELPPDHHFPFATLVTNDNYDNFSNLSRPSVFRLNVGVGKETYCSLFDSQSPSGAGEVGDGAYDFTALDQIMPHPVYGRQYWVCVLNPSDATFHQSVRPLLAEAYELSARRQTKARPADES